MLFTWKTEDIYNAIEPIAGGDLKSALKFLMPFTFQKIIRGLDQRVMYGLAWRIRLWSARATNLQMLRGIQIAKGFSYGATGLL